MGRRSRKRSPDLAGGATQEGSTRAERDAARRQRAADARAGRAAPSSRRRNTTRRPLEERPPPLWGSFPLSEILILVGLVLMVWGFLSGGDQGAASKLAAGLAIASLGGLEIVVREHLTGFRSHSSLLAAAVGIVTIVLLGFVAGVEVLGILLIAGLLAGGVAFYLLRHLFRRRSGGASFR